MEEKLEIKLSATDIEALQRDLEIMRAARVLPMGQSDLVIDLIMHVRHKHSELASRLHALHLPDKAPTERQLAILK